MFDFILTGIARSGTTAFAEILELHQGVVCGRERFFASLCSKETAYPNAHFDMSLYGNINEIDRVDSIIYTKKIELVGEKNPEYVYYPEFLSSVKRCLLIYRKQSEVARSWDQRSSNKEDDSWNDFKSGIISFFDHFFLFYFIPNDPKFCFIDYNKLFSMNYESELNSVFEYLNLSSEKFDYAGFEARYATRNLLRTPLYECSEYYDADNVLGISNFESDFFSSEPCERYRIILRHRDFIVSHAGEIMRFMVDLLNEREALYFLEFSSCLGWSDKRDPIMTTMLDLTKSRFEL